MFQGIINAILSYMDRPWKVFALLTFLVIGATIYIIYEQRNVLTAAFLHEYIQPVLLVEHFQEHAGPLLQATGADVAVLATVKLAANEVQPVAGYNNHGAKWIPNPSARPLLHERSEPKVFIDIVQGNAFCRPVRDDLPLLRTEYAAGLRYICAIGVPRMIGVLTGLLYVGWFTPPSPEQEYAARLILQTEAEKVLDW